MSRRADTSARRSSRRWKPALVVVALLAVALVVLTLFPIRAWMAQRSKNAAAAQKLALIEEQNTALEAQIAKLKTPTEVERRARASYGMVRPGEVSYAILPSANGAPQAPNLWPYAS